MAMLMEIQTYKAQAEACCKQGLWSDALSIYKMIELLSPDSWDNQIAIADAYLNIGEWDKAAEFYMKSIDNKYEFDWAWHNLAVAYEKLDNWNEVVRCHSVLDEINPDFFENNSDIPLVIQHYEALSTQKIERDSDVSLPNLTVDSSNEEAISIADSIHFVEKERPPTQNSELYYAGIQYISGNVVVGWIDKRDSGVTESFRVSLYVNDSKTGTCIANYSSKEVAIIDSPAKGRCWFKLYIPDQYLDGNEHLLRVQCDNGYVIDEVDFTFSIHGHIDIFQLNHISGWIRDLNSNYPLELDLHIDSKKLLTTSADLSRHDVTSEFGCGFNIFYDQRLHQRQVVTLTLAKSNIGLFNTPKVLFPEIGAVNALHALGGMVRRESHNLDVFEKQWLLEKLIPGLIDEFRASKRENRPVSLAMRGKECFDLHNQTFVKSSIVDVIIPVYRNYEVTKRCVEAAVSAQNDTPFNVLVIDDQGPEEEIHEYLRLQGELGRIELLVNQENKGFVHSVNRGMAQHPDRDVVLLNSDAIVCDFWLDRLTEAANSGVSVASATPLSNHASIFSYPRLCEEVSDLPEDVSLQEMADLAYQVNGGQFVRVPAMHGFCCLLKREALLDIGLFDEEKWGKGYGEEVDWSQKARRNGWEHAAVPGVFVEHVGSQSFVESKDQAIGKALTKLAGQFPEFDAVIQDFITEDPLAEYRRRIDLQRLKRQSNRYILFVAHDYGGGTMRHMKDMARFLMQEKAPVILLSPDKQGFVKLTCPEGIDVFTRYDSTSQDDIRSLREDLKEINVFHTHVHSTLGFDSEPMIWELISSLDLPYDITIHDYHVICPRVNLTLPNGKYCGEPNDNYCNICIQKNGTYSDDASRELFTHLGSIEEWRHYYSNKLKNARKIFTPSKDTCTRLMRYFTDVDIDVRPHPETMIQVNLGSKITRQPSPFRVAIIGAISDIKGYYKIQEIAEYSLKFDLPIEFIIFGHTQNDGQISEFSNIKVVGKYTCFSDLQLQLEKYPCDISAFFSLWPETYSYTLSESLSLGLIPLTLDIGAIAERVSQIPGGYIVSSDASTKEITEKIIQSSKDARTRTYTFSFDKFHSYDSYIDDYYWINN